MLNAADNQYNGEEKKTFPRNKDGFLHSTMYVFISEFDFNFYKQSCKIN